MAGRHISYLSGFQTVILEKGTLEEQSVTAAECSECVCVCVCPSELHIKGLKVHFPGRGALHRPLPELCVVEAGLCTPTNSIFPSSRQCSGRSCCSQHEGDACPRGLRQRRVGTKCSTGVVGMTSRASYFLFLFSTCL